MLKQLKKMNQKINPISAPLITYKGFESIDHSSSAVYVCNHLSEEDITLLDHILSTDIHIFIREKEVNRNRNVLKKRMYTAYKELNDQIYREMETILSNGVSIFFFPESTFSSNGILMPLNPDIANLFKRTKALVYPMHINGANHIKSFKFKDKIIEKTEDIQISVGSSFYPYTDEDGTDIKNESIIHRLYAEMNNQAYYSLEKQNVNLYNEMVDRIKKNSDSAFGIQDENTFLSYNKFLVSVNVLSARFDKLFQKEERIGTLLPTSIGYAMTLFSLFKSSKTPVILNFTMGIENLSKCCETANIRTILTSKEFVRQANLSESLTHLSDQYQILYLEDIKSQLTSGENILGLSEAKRYKKIKHSNDEIIFFTSGSENTPKGVILTHDNIYANIMQAVTTVHISPADKIMNTLPMFHSFGMTAGAILPIIFGLNVYLFPSPISYKKIPKLIYEEQSTIVFGTPTFFLNYAKAAETHHMQTIRYAVAGSEKLKEEVKDLWSRKFGIRIIEGYGVTETSPIVSLNRPYNHTEDSVGQLLPGMTHKIESVEGIPQGGNLLVKGPNIMRGYLIHGKGYIPHEGWYKTGDVVEISSTGHLFIKARLKRFAKLGGEMVSLNQVEQIASLCYGHERFAAVSIPDKRKGEKVILYTTDNELKDRSLKRYIKDHKLSNLLLPAKIEVISEIPLLGSGKTNYIALQNIANESYGKK